MKLRLEPMTPEELARANARRAARSVHAKILIAAALLALAVTIVDQYLGIGRGGMITYANLFTILAWGAFTIHAAITTALVLPLARTTDHVVMIHSIAAVSLVAAVMFRVSQHGAGQGASRNLRLPLSGEAAAASAAKCLTSLERWSWSETDRFSASIHLEVVVPGPVKLTTSVQATANYEYLLESAHTKMVIDRAGRADLDLLLTHSGRVGFDLALTRLQPGRPDDWEVRFQCDGVEAIVTYAQRKVDTSAGDQVGRFLPPPDHEPARPMPTRQEYDLFTWKDSSDQLRFVLRQAVDIPLDKRWRHESIGETMAPQHVGESDQPLMAQLLRLPRGSTIRWWLQWPRPEAPEQQTVGAVTQACRTAGLTLLRPPPEMPQRKYGQSD